MTDDYTLDELREWCELAGLRVVKREKGYGTEGVVLIPGTGWEYVCTSGRVDPFLLAGVAEILVAMVQMPLDKDPDPFMCALIDEVGRDHGYARRVCKATAAQRCRAAVAVLEALEVMEGSE